MEKLVLIFLNFFLPSVIKHQWGAGFMRPSPLQRQTGASGVKEKKKKNAVLSSCHCAPEQSNMRRAARHLAAERRRRVSSLKNEANFKLSGNVLWRFRFQQKPNVGDPAQRFVCWGQVWIIAQLSHLWKDPIWKVFSWSKYNWTNHHPLRRKRRELQPQEDPWSLQLLLSFAIWLKKVAGSLRFQV